MAKQPKCRTCGGALNTGEVYCSRDCHTADVYPDSERIHARALELRTENGYSYANIAKCIAREFPESGKGPGGKPLSVPRIRSIVMRAAARKEENAGTGKN